MLRRCAVSINLMQTDGIASALKEAGQRVQGAADKAGRSKPVNLDAC